MASPTQAPAVTRQHHREHGYNFHPHLDSYGGNPLAQVDTRDSGGARLPASAAYFQPGTFRVPDKKQANPAPLALSGFALTTFVLNLVNLGTKGSMKPNLVAGSAIAYGGLVQILAGMWEMGFGNTFAAWAFCSYGGFWLALGIILTPGLFEIEQAYGGMTVSYENAFGLFLISWFVFTFIVLIATIRSTLAFFMLLLTVDMNFLLTGISYLDNSGGAMPMPNNTILKAGGGFGIIAAAIAWFIMLAGLLEPSNSFFTLPALHFPWSEKGREARGKSPPSALSMAPLYKEGSNVLGLTRTNTRASNAPAAERTPAGPSGSSDEEKGLKND